MAGTRKRRRTPEQRYDTVVRTAHRVMRATHAKRAAETRALCAFDYIRGDVHTHTTWSDGMGDVAESVATMEARGLDFLFITDHGTVRQKVECRRHARVWWGQEPGAGPHHVCVLDINRKYTPVKDMARDAARLRALGAFFFYPHPTGWFPSTHYAPEQIVTLDAVGDAFAMEVLNGFGRIEPFHDKWTEESVALWDKYLCAGKRVIGLGASDAHGPLAVGVAWTGLPGAKATKAAVLAALRSGNAFASSGPAINLTRGRTPMGAAARVRAGRATFALECADAYGLNWVQLVLDGRVAKRFELRGGAHLRENVTLDVPAGTRYVRAECAANDDRRAYGNPVYLA